MADWYESGVMGGEEGRTKSTRFRGFAEVHLQRGVATSFSPSHSFDSRCIRRETCNSYKQDRNLTEKRTVNTVEVAPSVVLSPQFAKNPCPLQKTFLS